MIYWCFSDKWKPFIGYFHSLAQSSTGNANSEIWADQINGLQNGWAYICPSFRCVAYFNFFLFILSSSTQNLAEIQTYVNILQQINQTLPLVPNVSLGTSEVRSISLWLCVCQCVCACVCICAVFLRGKMVFACVSPVYVPGVDESCSRRCTVLCMCMCVCLCVF